MGMYYSKNYAMGTERECRCDNWCDNFCDDEPNGCARTCRILNGVFEHTPSVHAGDRTCAWHAYSVSNPVNYEGYDCSWMAGTGEGPWRQLPGFLFRWRLEVPGGQPEPEQLPLLTMVSVHEERVSPISEIRWWAKGEGADVHLSRLLQAPSTVSSSQERAEERTACIIRR